MHIFSIKEFLNSTMQCDCLFRKTDLEIKEEFKNVDNLFVLHAEICFELASCCLFYEYRGNQAIMRGGATLYITVTKSNCLAPSMSACVDNCCRVIHTGKKK